MALRDVLAKDPAYPKAHLELGRMAYEEGKTAEAITEFEQEVKAHPDDSQSGAALAGLYAEAGRTEDAIRVLEGIAARDPSNTDVLVSLDGLYTGKGETQKSEEIYKKVLAQNPEGADLVYYRVGAQITKKSDLGEADRARAMAAFNKAIQLNPRNAKAHRELGYLLLGAGKIDEAKKHFQSYLEIDPAAKDASSIKQFLQGG